MKLLKVAELPGIGSVSLRRVIKEAASSGEVPTPEWVQRVFSNRAVRSEGTPGSAEAITERCIADRIGIVTPLDPAYPSALRLIEDFPPFLYFKGDVGALQMPSAAVVGTREASKLGMSWAKQIAEVFAANHFCVVSGLALGIDTGAHEGALRAGGRTVAILAHGLHQVSPASNRELAENILSTGGALVSEHPPGTPPRRAEFVRRNRLQSGMSVCSVVVESGFEGGAIHQGNFTAKQGRKLYCVAPDNGVAGAEQFNVDGARRLERDAGAILLHNREQLLSEIASGKLQSAFARYSSQGSRSDLLI